MDNGQLSALIQPSNCPSMNLQGWHVDTSPWLKQVSVVALSPSLFVAGHSWHQETVTEEKEGKMVLGGL